MRSLRAKIALLVALPLAVMLMGAACIPPGVTGTMADGPDARTLPTSGPDDIAEPPDRMPDPDPGSDPDPDPDPTPDPGLLDVVSFFDDDDEGWQVEGGVFPAPARPSWSPVDGATGGEVSADSYSNWYWIAPSKFRGDKSAAYGQSLKFYLNRSNDSCASRLAENIVVLEGAGMKIRYSAGYGPGNGWTYYSIGLIETNEWFHAGNNTRVTKAELIEVLADLGQLKIRGWFNDCNSQGVGGLDDVVLKLDGLGREAPGEPYLAARFDADPEGWTVANGSFDRSGPVAWQATGGGLDGQLTATGFGNWTWLAPQEFRGDMSAAYGGSLKFDLNRSNDSCRARRAESLVKLQGGGYAIVLNASYGVGSAWTHFSARLHETEPWFHKGTNNRVSGDEMQAVLADLGQIKIRGWFNDCNSAGTGGLDNVVLELSGTDIVAPSGDAIESDFSGGDERWAVANGSFDTNGPVLVNSSGGSPGGYVSANGSSNWYWIAPPEFRGDLSNAYGQTIRFDLNRSVSNCPARTAGRLIVIEGGGMSIYYGTDYAPDLSWTSFGVLLSETELWFHTTTDDRVTQAEIQQVLAAVGQIKIRGWFNDCNAVGEGGLDNVMVGLD